MTTTHPRRDLEHPLKITLPLPPVALSPNVRRHWAVKARAASEYRAMAMAEVLRTIPASKRPRWIHAETQAVFYYGANRRRDGDNAGASLKPAWDGIADAGVVVNDSGLRHMPPVLKVDRINPRVELIIKPTEAP